MSHTAQILLIVLILVLVSISVCFVASAKTEQMEYPFKDWVFTENISSSGTALGQDNYRWNTVFGTAAAEGLDNGDLRYWVYLPKDYDPNKEYPLVVYLHGSTTSYKQNKGLTPWTSTINNKSLKLEKELRVAMGDCIIFAPQIPGDAVGHAVGHAWSNMESKMWSRMTVDNTGSSIYLKAVEKKMADFTYRK